MSDPLRTAPCETIKATAHTSARLRLEQGDAEPASGEIIQPIVGVRGPCVMGMTATEFLHVLDWTGRQVHPNKRGTLVGPPPHVLRRPAHDVSPWPRQVLAVGSDFHRAMGAAESLIAKAAAMGQRWLQGISVARRLAKASS